MKSSVNLKIDNLQNELTSTTEKWDDYVDEVDQSVERRTAVVVERMGFRATAKRRGGLLLNQVKGLGASAVEGVGIGISTVGTGVKGLALGGYERLRSIGGTVSRKDEVDDEKIDRVMDNGDEKEVVVAVKNKEII